MSIKPFYPCSKNTIHKISTLSSDPSVSAVSLFDFLLIWFASFFHSLAFFVRVPGETSFRVYSLLQSLCGRFVGTCLLSSPKGLLKWEFFILEILLISAISKFSVLTKESFLFCIFSICSLISFSSAVSFFAYCVATYLFPFIKKYFIKFWFGLSKIYCSFTAWVKYEQPPAKEQSTTDPSFEILR